VTKDLTSELNQYDSTAKVIPETNPAASGLKSLFVSIQQKIDAGTKETH
jgi:hypothetical protein